MVPVFEARDRVRADARAACQVADAPLKGGAGHSAL